MSVERQTVTLDDDTWGPLTFDVTIAGPDDGDSVVLLHGFPQTSHAWAAVIGPLTDAGYRVVAPDQRGYSPGACPDPVEAYATPSLAGDVLGLADALGLGRFHLVGHDWGAILSWYLAATTPDRLRSHTALSVPHPRAFAEAIMASMSGEGDQAARSGYVSMLREDGSEDGLLANDATGLRMIYAGSGLSTDEAEPYLAALSQRSALRGAVNWYRAGDPTTMLALPPVQAPTLYIWSTEDIALGREGAEATEAHVEGPYRFVVLEGVDHWIPEHATDEFVAEALAWFAAHP